MIVKCTVLCYYCLGKTRKPKQPEHICRTGESSASADLSFAFTEAADPLGRWLFYFLLRKKRKAGPKIARKPCRRLCKSPIIGEKTGNCMDKRPKVKYNNPEQLPGYHARPKPEQTLFCGIFACVQDAGLCGRPFLMRRKSCKHPVPFLKWCRSQKGRSLHVISQNP
nr:hypothetical protein [uncultured Gemmiger sp.]